jgi:glutaredoxin/glutathione-dependent peroxiredoxin
MPIKAGDKMPSGTLKTMTAEGPQDLKTDDLFRGKRVVLFSVPGAFTPTCHAKHLPGSTRKRARSGRKARTRSPAWP